MDGVLDLSPSYRKTWVWQNCQYLGVTWEILTHPRRWCTWLSDSNDVIGYGNLRDIWKVLSHLFKSNQSFSSTEISRKSKRKVRVRNVMNLCLNNEQFDFFCCCLDSYWILKPRTINIFWYICHIFNIWVICF